MSDKFPCLLCEARRLTKRHYEDRLFWIADCIQCGIPIIVIKTHTATISDRQKEKALELARQLFGDSAKFRGRMKLIKDHWHDHIVI